MDGLAQETPPPFTATTPEPLLALERAVRRVTGLEHDSSEVQPAQDERLASIAEELYRRHEDQDWRRRSEIIRNVALWDGDQWRLFDKDTRRLEEPRREHSWQVRMVFNIIRPIVRVAQSRLTKNPAVWHVIAGTQEEEHINAAKAATSMSQSEWDRMGMPRKMLLLILWVLIAGTGFLKLWWNPKARRIGRSPRLKLDADENPVYRFSSEDTGVYDFPGGNSLELDDDGLPLPDYETGENGEIVYDDLWEGDIECSVVSPLDVLRDPSAQTWDDVEWVEIIKEMPITRIFSRWGVKVAAESSQDKGTGALSRLLRHRTGDQSERVDTAIVKELHVRPGTFPAGDGATVDIVEPWVIISAAGRLLEQGPSPFGGCKAEFGWCPLIPFHELLSPGKPEGATIVSDLRSVQLSFNRTISQLIENGALTGSRQWLAPSDVILPGTSFNSRPGDVIKFRPGQHGIIPKPIEGGGASAQVHRLFEILNMLIEMISGQREGGLKGGTPPGMVAGVALEAVAERDESRFAATVQDIELGTEQWGNKVLHLVRRGWTEERMVSVVGEGMREDVIAFCGEQITERMHLRVVPESAQPRSKSLRNQRAVDLFQMGGFGDLRDPLELRRATRELRRRLGEGIGDEANDLVLKNIQNAERENREILETGQTTTLPEIHMVEEHDIHAEIHTGALLSARYRKVPQAQLALIAHLQEAHIPFLASLMGPQQGEGAEGGPGGPGGGGGPGGAQAGAGGI